MFRILRLLGGLGLTTAFAMNWFGFGPKKITGEPFLQVVFFTALGIFAVGLLSTLFEVVVANARTVEPKRVDVTAIPEREFGYRWQRAHAGIAFAFAGVLFVPLLVLWPSFLLFGVKEATHPGLIGLFVFVFLVGLMLFVVGRRCWSARVLLYPDRLAVCGIYSNGSLRWDAAREFALVEMPAGRWNTLWAYCLIGDTYSVRVESTVETPDEFVREVEGRTGLTLEKRPID